jgi:tetratricopeptide (TPR) repeat protein
LFAKLNPVNLFRKEPKLTPLPPASTMESPAVSAGTPPEQPAPVLREPPVTPAPTVPATPAEPVPLVVPRYTYRNPARPTPGNRPAAMARFSAAMQAASAGRPGAAADAYRQATQLDPAFFEAYYNLALTEQKQRQLAPALADYEHALASNPDQAGAADARFNFALALRDAGYLLDAVAELQKLVGQHPAEVRAQLALANLYAQKLRQPQNARMHYLKVLELDPRHPQAGSIGNWLLANPG